jgi:hypothetical protein
MCTILMLQGVVYDTDVVCLSACAVHVYVSMVRTGSQRCCAVSQAELHVHL